MLAVSCVCAVCEGAAPRAAGRCVWPPLCHSQLGHMNQAGRIKSTECGGGAHQAHHD